MARFHRGQNDALIALLAEFRFDETGSFGPWEGSAIAAFQNQISKAHPWKEHLTEFDVLRVLFSRLYRFIERIPVGYVGLLRDIREEGFLQEIEADIRSFFESIPRPYFVYFPLPQWMPLGIAELKLGEGISLIDTSVSNDTQKEKITSNLLRALLVNEYGGLRSGMRYLKLSAFGYCYSSMESEPVAVALAALKQLLFFGLTSNFLHTRRHPFLSMPLTLHEHSRSAFARHQEFSEGEEISIELPVEIAEYLHNLQIDESQLKYRSEGKTLLGGEYKLATRPEEKTEAIHTALVNACTFINLPQNDPDMDRVRTAIQWYIDAETTQNQAISFLQRCIGLEALLGTDDESRERGVTERLSDRFAYLIGKTQSERVKWKKEFAEIYAKRSDIVHSRVARLQTVDYEASKKAELLLSIGCRKEISTPLHLKKS